MNSRLSALVALCGLAACNDPPSPTIVTPGGETPDPSVSAGAPAVTFFDPDVPAWRGGCFFGGLAGKIVNGSPSPDVRMFGHACDGTPGGIGGIVYLDRHDPVSGTGDVTVLLSNAGSRPMVVGPRGGAGGTVPGSTGARLNDDGTQLLTLSEVAAVSGTLQLVSLFPAPSAKVIADRVRVENYDFLPGDAVLFVGNYDASRRVGDLFYVPRGRAAQPVVVGAARVEFVLYRLSPDRRRVAYLHALRDGSLQLEVSTLPPGAAPTVVERRVAQVAWTADGQRLVYLVASTDGLTSDVKAWEVATGTVVPLASGVNAATVVGNDVAYVQGWTVLAPEATLHVAPAVGGGDALTASAVSLDFAGVAAAPSGPVMAFVTIPDVGDPFTGELFLAAVPGFPRRIDAGITPASGFHFSPRASFVAYSKGFERSQASGNPSAQPGVAKELAVASPSGARFTLATDASFEKVAWHPDEAFVAAIGGFDPGRNSGELVVKRADGTEAAPSPLARGVNASWFGFSDDGSLLAAIRDWDDGLLRGELVTMPTLGEGAWAPTALPGGAGKNATFFVTQGSRVVYGVRGDALDGLWLAP
jgi:hypothetical protein